MEVISHIFRAHRLGYRHAKHGHYSPLNIFKIHGFLQTPGADLASMRGVFIVRVFS
jgi:hypothetical protein